jgi:aryl-alcohol dehydrogenase-like predicted oxidoreductase
MIQRSLGKSGLAIAPLALGGNVFGWTADEATSFRLLDAFVAAGGNFIDTADLYSRWAPGHHGGESESIIGRWLKKTGKRDRVFVATKVGMEMGPDKKGLSKAYILRAAEDSLRRLQVDCVDLYQAHTDDPQTPLEETLDAFASLIKQGKVRAIGASNYTADRLTQALETSRRLGLPRYECLQPHYNLCERTDYESKLEPVCLAHGIGVVSYFSLAKGFLTGKYRGEADLTKSVRGQGVKPYLNERGFRILAALDHIAKGKGSTPARVALAWLIARPSITAPIASATSLEQLTDLIESTKLELDRSAVEALNQASAWA